MTNPGDEDMRSAASDFDFLLGQWHVSHRRLKDRLAGSHDWEIFDGTSTVQAILGGAGNIDDNVLRLPSGTYRAVSLRTFEPATKLWSIWWLDGRYPTRIDTPVIGGFADGVGTFMADDVLAGTRIRVRFRWMRTDTAAPHWEQAFSDDEGASWETNWTMDFRRST
jgi:hypothetical protein